MSVKSALLFLNGTPPSPLSIQSKKYDIIAYTDGAYNYASHYPDLNAHYVIGDFDSVTQRESEDKNKSTVEWIHTPDQNKTDFEKALIFLLSLDVGTIDIYGATGKETDHFLGNIAIAKQYHSQVKLHFYDDFSEFYFADNQFKVPNMTGRIFSCIPFFEVKNLTLIGAEYPLTNADLHFSGLMSLRNRGDAEQLSGHFDSGDLLLIIQR